MYHRKKRYRNPATVDLNLAAMLDMAFQLLAFFILTFKPSPIEGQLGMHLPPPVPLTNVNNELPKAPPRETTNDLSEVEKLDVYIKADDVGDVEQIKVGLRPVVEGRLAANSLEKLKQHLKGIFEIKEIPFDRIQLVVDDELRYEELMKIIDVCTQQVLPSGETLKRISFVSASPGN